MHSIRVLALLNLLIVLALALVSCSAAQTTPLSQATATSSIPTAAVPQTTADTGAVKVVFFSTAINGPLVDGNICLATMIKLQGSVTGYVPSLNSKTSPCGNTDANGTLVISNVKPGKYGFAFAYPIGSHDLMKAEGSKEEMIMIDIVAGKVLDLGTMKVLTDPNKMQ